MYMHEYISICGQYVFEYILICGQSQGVVCAGGDIIRGALALCVCMYIYMYVIYTYIHIYIYVCMYVQIREYVLSCRLYAHMYYDV